jgi:hypothetical protein
MAPDIATAILAWQLGGLPPAALALDNTIESYPILFFEYLFPVLPVNWGAGKAAVKPHNEFPVVTKRSTNP